MHISALKSIDLFAGIGGIRLGFEQAFGNEIETVFVSEIDAKAQETYEANFGTDVSIRPEGENHVMVRIDVAVSPQFYGWLAGLGSRVQIASPEDVKEDYKKHLEDILSSFRE